MNTTTLLLAKQDLEHYSANDLALLCKYYGVPTTLSRADKVWALTLAIYGNTVKAQQPSGKYKTRQEVQQALQNREISAPEAFRLFQEFQRASYVPVEESPEAKPLTTKCSNPTSNVTKDAWSSTNPPATQITFYPSLDSDSGYTACYDEGELDHYINDPKNEMRGWYQNPCDSELLNSSGHHGVPSTVEKYYKIPAGDVTYYILNNKEQFEELIQQNTDLYGFPLIQNKRIGNKDGDFYEGYVHGQNPETIYYITTTKNLEDLRPELFQLIRERMKTLYDGSDIFLDSFITYPPLTDYYIKRIVEAVAEIPDENLDSFVDDVGMVPQWAKIEYADVQNEYRSAKESDSPNYDSTRTALQKFYTKMLDTKQHGNLCPFENKDIGTWIDGIRNFTSFVERDDKHIVEYMGTMPIKDLIKIVFQTHRMPSIDYQLYRQQCPEYDSDEEEDEEVEPDVSEYVSLWEKYSEADWYRMWIRAINDGYVYLVTDSPPDVLAEGRDDTEFDDIPEGAFVVSDRNIPSRALTVGLKDSIAILRKLDRYYRSADPSLEGDNIYNNYTPEEWLKAWKRNITTWDMLYLIGEKYGQWEVLLNGDDREEMYNEIPRFANQGYTNIKFLDQNNLPTLEMVSMLAKLSNDSPILVDILTAFRPEQYPNLYDRYTPEEWLEAWRQVTQSGFKTILYQFEGDNEFRIYAFGRDLDEDLENISANERPFKIIDENNLPTAEDLNALRANWTVLLKLVDIIEARRAEDNLVEEDEGPDPTNIFIDAQYDNLEWYSAWVQLVDKGWTFLVQMKPIKEIISFRKPEEDIEDLIEMLDYMSNEGKEVVLVSKDYDPVELDMLPALITDTEVTEYLRSDLNRVMDSEDSSWKLYEQYTPQEWFEAWKDNIKELKAIYVVGFKYGMWVMLTIINTNPQEYDMLFNYAENTVAQKWVDKGYDVYVLGKHVEPYNHMVTALRTAPRSALNAIIKPHLEESYSDYSEAEFSDEDNN